MILDTHEQPATTFFAAEEREIMSMKNGVYWITVSLAFILVIGSIASVADFGDNDSRSAVTVSEPERGKVHVAGTPHAPTVIDGDANFSDTVMIEGWPGDGSSGTPYIINGLDINRGGAAGHCISISNTRAYFIIRDCYLVNASVGNGAGVFLLNVIHGQLLNNTCTKNQYGILIGSSSANCTLADNTCTFNIVSGIYLDRLDSLLVRTNDCSWNSEDGIDVRLGTGHTIVDNTCNNNDYSGLIVGGSFHNVINNTCENNENGILSYGPNSINDNMCYNNSFCGMILGDNNNAFNNTCRYNAIGTYIDTEDCTLTDNYYISNQLGFYLSVDSWYNVLHWNVFLDNHETCNDLGMNIIDYNFWSDYSGVDWDYDGIGDTSYWVSGNSDPHPLMFLPTLPSWIEHPSDHTAELGLCFRYDLNATVPELHMYPNTTHITPKSLAWSVNDTAHFYIDRDGVITSWNLELKDYGLKITVSNFYGRSIGIDIKVRVVEYLPPEWVNILTDLSLNYGEPLDYQVVAMDNAGIAHWTLNDTANFVLTTHNFLRGGTARVTNSTVLTPGAYGLNITAYDLGGNSVSGVFSVLVNSPESDTTTPEGIDPVMTLVLGAGLGGAAVLVLVVVVLRKKS